jgi:lipoate-protein ligase B
MLNKLLQIKDLGVTEFMEAYFIQKNLVEQRMQSKIPDTFVLVEHPPVITLGRYANPQNLLALKHNIEVVHTDRGGDITFHGPGQLVCYPVIDLKNFNFSLKKYIRYLEETVIRLLATYNIIAKRFDKFVGVWVDGQKIASIGVRLRKWISMHGVALNVNTDLTYFDLVVPCGIKDVKMTSMQKILARKIEMQEVKNRIIYYFCRLFGYETILDKVQTPVR